jgi:hypothetical protein
VTVASASKLLSSFESTHALTHPFITLSHRKSKLIEVKIPQKREKLLKKAQRKIERGKPKVKP